MADPAFGALGTISATGMTYVSSLTSTITNISVSDMVLAFVQRDKQSLCSGVTINGASATLLKRNAANTAEEFGIDVWGVIAASSASSASVVASYSGAAQWGTIFSARWTPGVTSITPLASSCNTAGCSGLATSSTNRLTQSITTGQRALIIAVGTDWNDYRTHTAASGWTERADGSGSPVTSIQFVFDRVSDAGTFGGATAFSTTSASDQYAAVMLALAVDAAAASTGFASKQSASKFNHLLVR